MATRVVPAGQGEVVGDAPDRRVEILSDHPAVNATWSRFGPGRAGADLHVHREHTDCFFVLDGELELRLGLEDERRRLGKGEFAKVPPLVVHGFGNASDADVRYLNFHIPGNGFADYMRGIRDRKTVAYDQHDPPEDGGRDPAEASVGLPREPFELRELAEGEGLETAGGFRCIFVLSGAVAGEDAGAWLELAPGDAAVADRASRLLTLDVGGE
jgi:quercetin dioxygenase-like cupin family protein